MNRYSQQNILTYLDPALDPPKDCYTQCTVDASYIQVLYWPVDNGTTGASNLSTTTAATPFTLVSDGFSYISPSVYVIYRSLCANANIGLLDLSPDPGLAPSGGLAPFGTVYTTTIGYPPEAISTSHCFLDGWKAMNYHDIQHSHSYRVCGETSPYFSFPIDITALDPAWNGCKVTAYGGLDPPRALNKAAHLIPDSIITRLDPSTLASSTAAPGSRAGNGIVSPTATSIAVSRATSVPQTVPRPLTMLLNEAPTQAEVKNDQHNDEKSDPSDVVKHLGASFATTHPFVVAPSSDQAVSKTSNYDLAWNTSGTPPTPLSSNQALRVAHGDRGTSYGSKSHESASIVSEGKHDSPTSPWSGSKQGLGMTYNSKNDSSEVVTYISKNDSSEVVTYSSKNDSSEVEVFTGGCSGKRKVMKKLGMALVICMGFRAVAFVM